MAVSLSEGLGRSLVFRGFSSLAGRAASFPTYVYLPACLGTPIPVAMVLDSPCNLRFYRTTARGICRAHLSVTTLLAVLLVTYLAVHLELGCCHHRTAGRPWRVGPRGCWRAALVVVTAGWHHRIPGSIMAPIWPLAGTAACRGLAEVARGDGLAHGDLRPGESRLAFKWRGRIGFAQEASAAASPRWHASFVPSC